MPKVSKPEDAAPESRYLQNLRTRRKMILEKIEKIKTMPKHTHEASMHLANNRLASVDKLIQKAEGN